MIWNRRHVLQIGCLGGLGISIDNYSKLLAQNTVSKQATAQAVIYIYLPGGFSAQETFDPKPLAPIEYRGPFGSINTSIIGLQFGQHLKETAKVADKLTVIHSMSHGESAHERGTNNMFTGWRPSPALQYPSIGSVVSHELGNRNNIPAYISIPNIPNEFANAGYLSHSYSSFSLGSNPESADFKVRDLQLPPGIDVDRFKQRKRLLSIINNSDFISNNKSHDSIKAVDSFYENAFSLIDSKQAIEAFDLSKENEQIKEMYGKNAAGMRMLLSRRLIEGGVRFVTMTYGAWDMHQNIKSGIEKELPIFDKAFAALIIDLEQRGLLDSTLVLIASEFGRTPKINNDAGRDHWPRVFSSVMAGGGIKRGLVYGKSDATSNDVSDNPVSPENWAATIFDLLGINYENTLYAPGNRPVKIIDGGNPIGAVIA